MRVIWEGESIEKKLKEKQRGEKRGSQGGGVAGHYSHRSLKRRGLVAQAPEDLHGSNLSKKWEAKEGGKGGWRIRKLNGEQRHP